MSILEIAHNAIGIDLKFDIGKCLRNFKSSNCRSCLKACPHDAIVIKNNEVRLLHNKCNFCGICLSICPTEAFSSKPSISDLILKKLKSTRLSVFACEQSQQKNGLKVNCLASLSEAVLIAALVKTGSSILLMDKCEQCSIGSKAILIIKRKVRLANNLLQNIGVDAKVEIMNKPVLVEERISREKFFQQLGSELISLGIGAYVKEASNNNLPSNRHLLNKIIENKEIKTSNRSSLPFFEVKINKENCNFCLKCRQICPTEALCFEKDHPHPNPLPSRPCQGGSREREVSTKLLLMFNMRNCIGCNLCVKACPSSSLKLTNKADLSLFHKKAVLIETTKFCLSCGQPLPLNQNECSKCKKKEKLHQQLTSLFQ